MSIALTTQSTLNERAAAFESAARGYFNALREVHARALAEIPVNTQTYRSNTRDVNEANRTALVNAVIEGTPYNSLPAGVRALVTAEEYAPLTGLSQTVQVANANFEAQNRIVATAFGVGYDASLRESRTHQDSPVFQMERFVRESIGQEGAALDATYRDALKWAGDRLDGSGGQLHNHFANASVGITLTGGYTPPPRTTRGGVPSTSSVDLDAGEGTAILAAAYNYAREHGEYRALMGTYLGSTTDPLRAQLIEAIGAYRVSINAAEDPATVAVPALLNADGRNFAAVATASIEASNAGDAYKAALVAAGIPSARADAARVNLVNEIGSGSGVVANGQFVPASVTVERINASLNAAQAGFATEVRANATGTPAVDQTPPVNPAAAEAEADQTPPAQTPPTQRPPAADASQRANYNADVQDFQSYSYVLGLNTTPVGRSINVDGITGTATDAAVAAARAVTPPIAGFPATGTNYTAMASALRDVVRGKLTGPAEGRAGILTAIGTLDDDRRITHAEGRLIDDLIPVIAAAHNIEIPADASRTDALILIARGTQQGHPLASEITPERTVAILSGAVTGVPVTPPPPAPPAPEQRDPAAEQPPAPEQRDPAAEQPPAPAAPARTDGGQFRITLRGDYQAGKSFSVLDVISDEQIVDRGYRYDVALPASVEALVARLEADPRIGSRDNAERAAALLIAGKNGLSNADADVTAGRVLQLPTPEEVERGVTAIAAAQFAAGGISAREASNDDNTRIVTAGMRPPVETQR